MAGAQGTRKTKKKTSDTLEGYVPPPTTTTTTPTETSWVSPPASLNTTPFTTSSKKPTSVFTTPTYTTPSQPTFSTNSYNPSLYSTNIYSQLASVDSLATADAKTIQNQKFLRGQAATQAQTELQLARQEAMEAEQLVATTTSDFEDTTQAQAPQTTPQWALEQATGRPKPERVFGQSFWAGDTYVQKPPTTDLETQLNLALSSVRIDESQKRITDYQTQMAQLQHTMESEEAKMRTKPQRRGFSGYSESFFMNESALWRDAKHEKDELEKIIGKEQAYLDIEVSKKEDWENISLTDVTSAAFTGGIDVGVGAPNPMEGAFDEITPTTLGTTTWVDKEPDINEVLQAPKDKTGKATSVFQGLKLPQHDFLGDLGFNAINPLPALFGATVPQKEVEQFRTSLTEGDDNMLGFAAYAEPESKYDEEGRLVSVVDPEGVDVPKELGEFPASRTFVLDDMGTPDDPSDDVLGMKGAIDDRKMIKDEGSGMLIPNPDYKKFIHPTPTNEEAEKNSAEGKVWDRLTGWQEDKYVYKETFAPEGYQWNDDYWAEKNASAPEDLENPQIDDREFIKIGGKRVPNPNYEKEYFGKAIFTVDANGKESYVWAARGSVLVNDEMGTSDPSDDVLRRVLKPVNETERQIIAKGYQQQAENRRLNELQKAKFDAIRDGSISVQSFINMASGGDKKLTKQYFEDRGVSLTDSMASLKLVEDGLEPVKGIDVAAKWGMVDETGYQATGLKQAVQLEVNNEWAKQRMDNTPDAQKYYIMPSGAITSDYPELDTRVEFVEPNTILDTNEFIVDRDETSATHGSFIPNPTYNQMVPNPKRGQITGKEIQPLYSVDKGDVLEKVKELTEEGRMSGNWYLHPVHDDPSVAFTEYRTDDELAATINPMNPDLLSNEWFASGSLEKMSDLKQTLAEDYGKAGTLGAIYLQPTTLLEVYNKKTGVALPIDSSLSFIPGSGEADKAMESFNSRDYTEGSNSFAMWEVVRQVENIQPENMEAWLASKPEDTREEWLGGYWTAEFKSPDDYEVRKTTGYDWTQEGVAHLETEGLIETKLEQAKRLAEIQAQQRIEQPELFPTPTPIDEEIPSAPSVAPVAPSEPTATPPTEPETTASTFNIIPSFVPTSDTEATDVTTLKWEMGVPGLPTAYADRGDQYIATPDGEKLPVRVYPLSATTGFGGVIVGRSEVVVSESGWLPFPVGTGGSSAYEQPTGVSLNIATMFAPQPQKIREARYDTFEAAPITATFDEYTSSPYKWTAKGLKALSILETQGSKAEGALPLNMSYSDLVDRDYILRGSLADEVRYGVSSSLDVYGNIIKAGAMVAGSEDYKIMEMTVFESSIDSLTKAAQWQMGQKVEDPEAVGGQIDPHTGELTKGYGERLGRPLVDSWLGEGGIVSDLEDEAKRYGSKYEVTQDPDTGAWSERVIGEESKGFGHAPEWFKETTKDDMSKFGATIAGGAISGGIGGDKDFTYNPRALPWGAIAELPAEAAFFAVSLPLRASLIASLKIAPLLSSKTAAAILRPVLKSAFADSRASALSGVSQKIPSTVIREADTQVKIGLVQKYAPKVLEKFTGKHQSPIGPKLIKQVDDVGEASYVAQKVLRPDRTLTPSQKFVKAGAKIAGFDEKVFGQKLEGILYPKLGVRESIVVKASPLFVKMRDFTFKQMSAKQRAGYWGQKLQNIGTHKEIDYAYRILAAIRPNVAKKFGADSDQLLEGRTIKDVEKELSPDDLDLFNKIKTFDIPLDPLDAKNKIATLKFGGDSGKQIPYRGLEKEQKQQVDRIYDDSIAESGVPPIPRILAGEEPKLPGLLPSPEHTPTQLQRLVDQKFARNEITPEEKIKLDRAIEIYRQKPKAGEKFGEYPAKIIQETGILRTESFTGAVPKGVPFGDIGGHGEQMVYDDLSRIAKQFGDEEFTSIAKRKVSLPSDSGQPHGTPFGTEMIMDDQLIVRTPLMKLYGDTGKIFTGYADETGRALLPKSWEKLMDMGGLKAEGLVSKGIVGYSEELGYFAMPRIGKVSDSFVPKAVSEARAQARKLGETAEERIKYRMKDGETVTWSQLKDRLGSEAWGSTVSAPTGVEMNQAVKIIKEFSKVEKKIETLEKSRFKDPEHMEKLQNEREVLTRQWLKVMRKRGIQGKIQFGVHGEVVSQKIGNKWYVTMDLKAPDIPYTKAEIIAKNQAAKSEYDRIIKESPNLKDTQPPPKILKLGDTREGEFLDQIQIVKTKHGKVSFTKQDKGTGIGDIRGPRVYVLPGVTKVQIREFLKHFGPTADGGSKPKEGFYKEAFGEGNVKWASTAYKSADDEGFHFGKLLQTYGMSYVDEEVYVRIVGAEKPMTKVEKIKYGIAGKGTPDPAKLEGMPISMEQIRKASDDEVFTMHVQMAQSKALSKTSDEDLREMEHWIMGTHGVGKDKQQQLTDLFHLHPTEASDLMQGLSIYEGKTFKEMAHEGYNVDGRKIMNEGLGFHLQRLEKENKGKLDDIDKLWKNRDSGTTYGFETTGIEHAGSTKRIGIGGGRDQLGRDVYNKHWLLDEKRAQDIYKKLGKSELNKLGFYFHKGRGKIYPINNADKGKKLDELLGRHRNILQQERDAPRAYLAKISEQQGDKFHKGVYPENVAGVKDGITPIQRKYLDDENLIDPLNELKDPKLIGKRRVYSDYFGESRGEIGFPDDLMHGRGKVFNPLDADKKPSLDNVHGNILAAVGKARNKYKQPEWGLPKTSRKHTFSGVVITELLTADNKKISKVFQSRFAQMDKTKDVEKLEEAVALIAKLKSDKALSMAGLKALQNESDNLKEIGPILDEIEKDMPFVWTALLNVGEGMLTRRSAGKVSDTDLHLYNWKWNEEVVDRTTKQLVVLKEKYWRADQKVKSFGDPKPSWSKEKQQEYRDARQIRSDLDKEIKKTDKTSTEAYAKAKVDEKLFIQSHKASLKSQDPSALMREAIMAMDNTVMKFVYNTKTQPILIGNKEVHVPVRVDWVTDPKAHSIKLNDYWKKQKWGGSYDEAERKAVSLLHRKYRWGADEYGVAVPPPTLFGDIPRAASVKQNPLTEIDGQAIGKKNMVDVLNEQVRQNKTGKSLFEIETGVTFSKRNVMGFSDLSLNDKKKVIKKLTDEYDSFVKGKKQKELAEIQSKISETSLKAETFTTRDLVSSPLQQSDYIIKKFQVQQKAMKAYFSVFGKKYEYDIAVKKGDKYSWVSLGKGSQAKIIADAKEHGVYLTNDEIMLAKEVDVLPKGVAQLLPSEQIKIKRTRVENNLEYLLQGTPPPLGVITPTRAFIGGKFQPGTLHHQLRIEDIGNITNFKSGKYKSSINRVDDGIANDIALMLEGGSPLGGSPAARAVLDAMSLGVKERGVFNKESAEAAKLLGITTDDTIKAGLLRDQDRLIIELQEKQKINNSKLSNYQKDIQSENLEMDIVAREAEEIRIDELKGDGKRLRKELFALEVQKDKWWDEMKQTAGTWDKDGSWYNAPNFPKIASIQKKIDAKKAEMEKKQFSVPDYTIHMAEFWKAHNKIQRGEKLTAAEKKAYNLTKKSDMSTVQSQADFLKHIKGKNVNDYKAHDRRRIEDKIKTIKGKMKDVERSRAIIDDALSTPEAQQRMFATNKFTQSNRTQIEKLTTKIEKAKEKIKKHDEKIEAEKQKRDILILKTTSQKKVLDEGSWLEKVNLQGAEMSRYITISGEDAVRNPAMLRQFMTGRQWGEQDLLAYKSAPIHLFVMGDGWRGFKPFESIAKGYSFVKKGDLSIKDEVKLGADRLRYTPWKQRMLQKYGLDVPLPELIRKGSMEEQVDFALRTRQARPEISDEFLKERVIPMIYHSKVKQTTSGRFIEGSLAPIKGGLKEKWLRITGQAYFKQKRTKDGVLMDASYYTNPKIYFHEHSAAVLGVTKHHIAKVESELGISLEGQSKRIIELLEEGALKGRKMADGKTEGVDSSTWGKVGVDSTTGLYPEKSWQRIWTDAIEERSYGDRVKKWLLNSEVVKRDGTGMLMFSGAQKVRMVDRPTTAVKLLKWKERVRDALDGGLLRAKSGEKPQLESEATNDILQLFGDFKMAERTANKTKRDIEIAQGRLYHPYKDKKGKFVERDHKNPDSDDGLFASPFFRVKDKQGNLKAQRVTWKTLQQQLKDAEKVHTFNLQTMEAKKEVYNLVKYHKPTDYAEFLIATHRLTQTDKATIRKLFEGGEKGANEFLKREIKDFDEGAVGAGVDRDVKKDFMEKMDEINWRDYDPDVAAKSQKAQTVKETEEIRERIKRKNTEEAARYDMSLQQISENFGGKYTEFFPMYEFLRYPAGTIMPFRVGATDQPLFNIGPLSQPTISAQGVQGSSIDPTLKDQPGELGTMPSVKIFGDTPPIKSQSPSLIPPDLTYSQGGTPIPMPDVMSGVAVASKSIQGSMQGIGGVTALDLTTASRLVQTQSARLMQMTKQMYAPTKQRPTMRPVPFVPTRPLVPRTVPRPPTLPMFFPPFDTLRPKRRPKKKVKKDKTRIWWDVPSQPLGEAWAANEYVVFKGKVEPAKVQKKERKKKLDYHETFVEPQEYTESFYSDKGAKNFGG